MYVVIITSYFGNKEYYGPYENLKDACDFERYILENSIEGTTSQIIRLFKYSVKNVFE